MIKTLSISELENQADNIYEAIIVLAKRARQINNEQKQVLTQESEYDDYYDNYEEEDTGEVSEAKYEKLPKPSTLALDDFLSGKIKYEYRDSKDEEEAAA